MRRAVTALLLALGMTVAFGSPVGSPSPVFAAGGLCVGQQAGNYHIYVDRHADDAGVAGTYFEHVSGRTTVRDLSPCVGGPGQGGTCMLMANIQGPASGFIVQLAYCQLAGSTSERFYYVASAAATPIQWPGSWTPVHGTEYRFEITRGALVGQPGKIIFKLVKPATGESQTVTITHSWSDDLDLAWWGAETLGKESVHGTFLSQLDAVGRWMQYQTETGPLTIRSYMAGQDGGDVILNFPVTDRHGKIKDGQYPGSELKVWTDD